jgi:hypothetical protein
MKKLFKLLYSLFLRVNYQKLTSLLVVVFSTTMSLLAQDDEARPRRGSRVIDDTTKQVYGPRTSRYYYEEDVFMTRDERHQVDTLIRNFHRFNDVQRNDNLYQDLGVIGTAIRPIYYQVPEVIGVTSGYNSFDVYWDRERIKYWDTKSPYSNMYVILGGRGRSITRATYSRNINPRWNFGFTYRGLFIDKQVSRQGKGDRNTRGQYYDFFTTYQTKDSTYRAFFNFRRNNHEVAEFGGVRNNVPANFTYKDYFSTDAQPWLTGVINRELRMNIHLFHQYSIGSGLQVYHKLDRYRQSNRYTEPQSVSVDFDYDEMLISPPNDKVKFSTLRNEFGIKGSLSKLFYNGYYAIRDYRMNYTYDTLLNGESNNVWKGTESYLGGRVAFKLDSLVDVIAWAEVMQEGNYRIEGTIRSKWFDATLKQAQYKPSFVQQYYRGTHDFWKNNFDDVNVTQLSGAVHYRSKVLKVSPGVSLTRIGNYVYFKRDSIGTRLNFYPKSNVDSTDVVPFQDARENVILSPSVNAELTILRHIYLRGQAIYTMFLANENDTPFRIPELLVNGQLSYENIFFNGNLDMHAGVDIHWQSAYYALAYDVPTSQFYVQADSRFAGFNDMGGKTFPGGSSEDGGRIKTPYPSGIQNVPIVDVFFNAKIKRGRVFFKYNNIFQLITKQGYFATPQYPGQRNVIDFGFDWSFYD